MNWQLQYEPNHQHCGEACLTLTQHNRCEPLRRWFGPMATQLARWLRASHSKISGQHPTTINKSLAQQLLMQASFHHQACLHRYHVTQDLPAQSPAMCDVLLYLRMSRLHPCQDTMETLLNTQMPHCQDLEDILQRLVQAELIQCINSGSQRFYDKNPYPHDHILDTQTDRLFDYTGPEDLSATRILIQPHAARYWIH
ncbi:hypothetical protein [Marinicella meishanensis]|uniref:hypothetical protein n=1 Tax=Marinicella meishanensis TaxID=2873263 RepID=UPI001CBE6CD3|nr:hypothetical protein [Marinicella sp. NBU2979]